MDYNTEKIAKIINLYLMLSQKKNCQFKNEIEKFITNGLLPALGEEGVEHSDISRLALEVTNDCRGLVDNDSQIAGEGNLNKMLLKQISSTAEDISNYNDKPLVSQLVCIGYILSLGSNDLQKEVIDLLKAKWKVDDAIIADIADTCETLACLRENRQKTAAYAQKKNLSFIIKNIFRKNKIPEKRALLEAEFQNDEKMLLNSLKELYATEGIK